MFFINGYFLGSKNFSGVQRFAFEILLAIDKFLNNELDYKNKFVIIIPKCFKDNFNLPNLVNITYVFFGKDIHQHLWEQIVLPLYVGKHFLINLCNLAPILKKNQLTVIHDTLVYIYPEAYSQKFVCLTKVFSKLIVKNSLYIATVSNFSKSEILKKIGLTKNDIKVLGNSAENFIKIKEDNNYLKKNNLLPQNYILAVFSQKNSCYKNIDNYLAAIKNINFTFVCVGNFDNKYFVNSNIIVTSFIIDEELKALYKNAYFLVFPSLYEGFGIPPLEAMVCGCPVLAANIPVLSEVCDTAAIYFDPHNINDINANIKYIIQNPQIRSTLIKNGYIRASKYTWNNHAENLFKILKSV